MYYIDSKNHANFKTSDKRTIKLQPVENNKNIYHTPMPSASLRGRKRQTMFPILNMLNFQNTTLPAAGTAKMEGFSFLKADSVDLMKRGIRGINNKTPRRGIDRFFREVMIIKDNAFARVARLVDQPAFLVRFLIPQLTARIIFLGHPF